jgi:hypothetical protein
LNDGLGGGVVIKAWDGDVNFPKASHYILKYSFNDVANLIMIPQGFIHPKRSKKWGNPPPTIP